MFANEKDAELFGKENAWEVGGWETEFGVN